MALPDFTAQFSKLLQIRRQLVYALGTGLALEDWQNVPLPQGVGASPAAGQLICAIQQGQRELMVEWLDRFYSSLAGSTASQAFTETLAVFDVLSSTIVAGNRTLQEALEQDAQFFGRLSHMESLQSMKMLMQQTLSMILDSLEASAANNHREIIQQICRIVQRDYGQALSLNSLAEEVFLSPNYLSAIFKEITGKNLLEYITDVRMENARRMLAKSNMKIHEIAHRVGYESPSYFGSVFLKRTGLTPNQYRINAQRS